MKTHDLIKMLLEEDPYNEMEVCVGNIPIDFVRKLPYFYDGKLSYFERDEKGKIIKCGWRRDFNKLVIYTKTVEECIYDNPDVEVDLSANPDAKYFVEQTKQDAKQLEFKLEE